VQAWCEAWRVAADGGHPMNGRSRRDLIAAAGGEDNIARYCAHQTAPTAATTSTTKPGKGHKPHPPKPSHPNPHANTPNHPGPNK
jgi:hypothetical protein